MWYVAGILLAMLVGMVLAADEHQLATLELESGGAYEDPESLAELVRYSEPFEIEGGVRVEVRARGAEAHLALVDSRDRVREASVWVSSRERVSFGRLPRDEYRLRLTASNGPVHARVLTGGFSLGLLAIAVFLLLAPPLLWTIRLNLR